MSSSREVVIVGAARTPIGAFRGLLAGVPAARLGAVAIRASLLRAGLDASRVDEVVMGNVLQAGQGQAPARQAALAAGLSEGTPCLTVNRMCGSGLEAVKLGARAILAGDAEVVVAGGMESMSNAPYYLPALRSGARMGDARAVDGLLLDGLIDAYEGIHMGVCAERTAAALGLTRQAQDAYALASTQRAKAAQASGAFAAEIAGVEVAGRGGELTAVVEDEGPRTARPEKIPTLRPVFQEDGTVTAANASSISDGAAAVVLMSAARAERERRPPLARLAGWASSARKPGEFTIAPADAVAALLARASLTPANVDLWELNEAFAVVALANLQLIGLDASRVNVRGGAIALGHPLGASGARLLVTLVHAMRDLGRRRGVATLCIGGGEAIAALVELP